MKYTVMKVIYFSLHRTYQQTFELPLHAIGMLLKALPAHNERMLSSPPSIKDVITNCINKN